MQNTISPFLMFEGRAEEALTFYTTLFKASKIESIIRYKANEAGKEGTVMLAVFSLNGQTFKCIDSIAPHDFTFTPSISFFIDCISIDEIKRLSAALSQDGFFLMPLDNYGFSQQFAWLQDRFGVTWQLNVV